MHCCGQCVNAAAVTGYCCLQSRSIYIHSFSSGLHRTEAEVLLIEGRPSVAVGGVADGRRVVVGGDDDVVGVGFGDELYEEGVWI